jgi:ASC-1-like (ASCH) protein
MDFPPAMDVQQPWLDRIYDGSKTVEGRTGSIGKYDDIIGKVIEMYDPADQEFRFPVLIVAVRHYDTLDEYIRAEGWQNIAPHTGSMKATQQAYADIYMPSGNGPVQVFSKERVAARGGINAIEVKKGGGTP